MTDGSTTWTYTYDANGLRTSRSDGTTTYKYVYNGGSLVQMTVGSDVLYFTSDTVTYNSTTYYYVTNLQGDIVAILNSSGNAVVEYTYDAWGNILSMSDDSGVSLGTINPLRYRGYVYDQETSLYYLQSRYYNPEMGRFLNADALASTGQGILGNNMFAYCNNNPVSRTDMTGLVSINAVVAKAIVGGIISAVCEFATGGSIKDVAFAFLDGLVCGALSELSKVIECGVIVFQAVKTVVECYTSGASLGDSLFAGAIDLVCSLVYVNDCELLIDCLFDLTFGMGFSLMSAGITEAIIAKHSNTLDLQKQEHIINSYPTNTTRSPIVTGPVSHPVQDYHRPAYTGMGWRPVHISYGSEYRVPIVNNSGWTK